MPLDPDRIRALVHAAAIKANPAERDAFLDAACADDTNLRQHIEALLQASPKPTTPLDATGGSVELPAAVAPMDLKFMLGGREPPGTPIGPYRLVEVIGEGGMGIVYRAEQYAPVYRAVALKVIKPGMDTRDVIARFEAERQALALMDHLHIAKVLDAGTTASGRPYFAMELVDGVPITRYCDETYLTVRERLELFGAVCRAVQHAHQKGIIHRDLKPSNILVAVQDGKPVPKVIDFGIAKALHQRLTERTLHTGVGTIMGTLEYMAPEQADPGTWDIDTRADIYSLGAILYELLTGGPPLDREQLREAGLFAVLWCIREDEPPPPSVRLSAAPQALPALAAARRTEPRRLARLVRGELDWIVMKALEKDRGRRYETVSGLTRDLEHYLADEPVTAGRPSRWYKAQKFVRRHRTPVVAGLLVLLALLGGVVGTTWALVRAVAAEQLAGQRLTELEQAHAKTKQTLAVSEAARARAETAEKQATAVADFLVSAFRKPDPFQVGRELKVVDLLDKAMAKLADDPNMAPLDKARLQDALGQTYFGLGLPDRAVPLLEQARAAYEAAYGVDHAETLRVMYRLMYTYGHADRNEEAIKLGELVLDRQRALLGPDHPDTLLTMGQLAGLYWSVARLNEAIPLAEQALAGQRKRLGPEERDLLPNSITNLARLYKAAGRTAAAVRLHEEAVALQKAAKGLDHPDTLLAVSHLGRAYRDAGRTDDAIALQRDMLDQLERKLGGTHPRTLSAMHSLADTYRSYGKKAEALRVSEKALELARKAPKLDPEVVLIAMQDLALIYGDLHRSTESLSLLREAVTTTTRALGPRHRRTLIARHNLGVALRQAGQPAEAVTVLEQALAGYEATVDEGDRERQVTTTQLAGLYVTLGRAAEAIGLLERLLTVQKQKLDPDHRDLLVTMNVLARAYGAVGRTDDAVRFDEQVVAICRKKFGPDHPDTQLVTQHLGAAYFKASRLAEAEGTYRDLLEVTRRTATADGADLAARLVGLGEVLLGAKQFEKAEGALREGLGILEKATPDAWTTLHARSLLGGSLLGQKKYAEAEPLLQAGYEGLRQRKDQIPPQDKVSLTETLERLVQLYEATGRKDQAAVWQKELEALPPSKPATKP
jgi:serine/threonine protein kinase